MKHVFLSYAREDEQRAELLAKHLESSGLDVWWDREIPPGQTWDDVIGLQLDTAACVVVLWSEASVQSRWVREEADRALARGCLIPVLIDAVEPPLGFGRIQAADLSDWQGLADEEAFVVLLTSIRGTMERDGPEARTESDPGGDSHRGVKGHKATPNTRRYRLWLPAAVLTVLGALFIWWFVGIRSDGSDEEAWFAIQGVDVESGLAGAPAKIAIWVNDTRHTYPSLGGVEWIELGRGMSQHRFRIPAAQSYKVRFEMSVRGDAGARHFISQDTDVFEALPHNGRYDLHEVVGGTRARPISATIVYRVARR